jgi:hypothetical protein
MSVEIQGAKYVDVQGARLASQAWSEFRFDSLIVAYGASTFVAVNACDFARGLTFMVLVAG